MAGDDLLASLVSGDPQSADKVRAIVAQLRGSKQLSQLAQLSGDSTLVPFGQKLQQQDQQNEVELGRNAMANRSDAIRDEAQTRMLNQGQGTLNETIRWHDMQDQERKDALQAKKDQQDYIAKSQNVIDAIGQYRQSPASLSRSPRTAALMDEVYRQYPEYDSTKFQEKQKAQVSFGSGPDSNLVKGADVAVQHLDTADELAKKLHNTQYPIMNMGINAWKKFTGSPEIKSFNTAKQIVSDEVEKFVIGGGSALADRAGLQKQLADADNPAALQDVTNTLRILMGGQLKGLQSKFVTAGLGSEQDFLKRLSPRTVGALGFGDAQATPQPSALPGATGGGAPPPGPGSGPPQSALPGAVGAAGGQSPAQPPGMQTTAQDGSPITPYNRAGLVQAMRPDRPAPSTPATEVPGVTIVKKHVNEKGELWALLSDGTEQKLDRTSYK